MSTIDFLNPINRKILQYISKNREIVNVTDEALSVDNLSFYTLKKVFPSLNNILEYNGKFEDFLHKTEADVVLKTLRETQIPKLPSQIIVFQDPNPYLGGNGNAYGKALMEMSNDNILYETLNDLYYDIYLAGRIIEIIFKEFIDNTSLMTLLLECGSYTDVINFGHNELLLSLLQTRMVTIDYLTKNEFLSRLGEFEWVKDEQRNPDIFARIFSIHKITIEQNRINREVAEKFSLFVDEVISKCPDNVQEKLKGEKVRMFNIPYTRDLKNIMNKFKIIKNIAKYNFSPKVTTYTLRRNSTVSTGPKIVITRFDKSDMYSKYALDGTIGKSAMRNFITTDNILGENIVSNKNTYSPNATYHELYNQFKCMVEASILNRICSIVFNIISPYVDRVRNISNKRVVYSGNANFFGNTDNFVGKAIEFKIHERDSVLLLTPLKKSEDNTCHSHIPVTSVLQASLTENKTTQITIFPMGNHVWDKWLVKCFNDVVAGFNYIEKKYHIPQDFNFGELFYHVWGPYVYRQCSGYDNDKLEQLANHYRVSHKIGNIIVTLLLTNVVDLTDDQFIEFSRQGRTLLSQADPNITDKYNEISQFLREKLRLFVRYEDITTRLINIIIFGSDLVTDDKKINLWYLSIPH